MSILDQGSSKFRYYLSFMNSATGKDYTRNTTFGVGYSMTEWLFLEGSLPVKESHYEGTTEDYDVSGMGDLQIQGSLNLNALLFGSADDKKKTEDKETSSKPYFSVGFGVKFASGSNEETTSSGATVPANYQPGTGMEDYLFSASYFQTFGQWTPYASLSYTMTGPMNDQNYERGDSYAISGGTRYLVDPDRAGSAIVALIISTTLENDVLAGVESTNEGTYTYYQLGYTFRPIGHMDMSLSAQFPLTSPEGADDALANDADIDYQITLTVGYKF